jgi:hypothetical protein
MLMGRTGPRGIAVGITANCLPMRDIPNATAIQNNDRAMRAKQFRPEIGDGAIAFDVSASMKYAARHGLRRLKTNKTSKQTAGGHS